MTEIDKCGMVPWKNVICVPRMLLTASTQNIVAAVFYVSILKMLT